MHIADQSRYPVELIKNCLLRVTEALNACDYQAMTIEKCKYKIKRFVSIEPSSKLKIKQLWDFSFYVIIPIICAGIILLLFISK